MKQVTFHDVVAYFFEDEWKLLHEWQKELYKNVMKDIHEVLIALGYRIVNAGTLLEIYKSEDIQGPNDLPKKADVTDPTASCLPTVNPDLLLRITHDEDICCKETQIAQDTVIINCPSTGNGHMRTSKKNKEKCTQTLDSALRLSRKEKVSQHSRKKRPYKKLNKSQMKLKKTVVKRPTKLIDCKSGANKSKNDFDKLGAQAARTARTARHECTECEKHFTKKSSLNRHLRTHTADKPMAVSECQESYIENCKLTNHPRTHTEEKPCAVSECQESYIENSKLTNQPRTHTEEKPCAVSDCRESSIENTKLSNHQRKHAGEKPKPNLGTLTLNKKTYTCIECGKSYTRKDTLTKHQKIQDHNFNKKSSFTSHQKKTSNSFTCNQCGKSFGFSSNLLRHQQIHSAVKPFACNECGKCFRRSSCLLSHQRVHVEMQLYTCNECGKCFGDAAILLKHHQTHTGAMEPEAS